MKTVCETLKMPRSSFYSKIKAGVRRKPTFDEELAALIHALIKDEPSFGYRRVWSHLKFRQGIDIGREKVRRIMRIKGWKAKPVKRPGRGRTCPEGRKRQNVVDPKRRIVTSVPNVRWATDATKVYVQEAGWMNLVPVLDCCSSKVLSHVFSERGRAQECLTALEDAVIGRFGGLDSVPEGLSIRHDNGSVFLSRKYIKATRLMNISQEFTPYHCPSANGVAERWMRTFKEECAWCHNFKTISEAEEVIGNWIKKYNEERMHSRLGYVSPAEFEEKLRKKAA